MKYTYELRCPYCKAKNHYQPRKKGELYAKLNPLVTKVCIRCGRSFLVKENIVGERNVKKK